MSDVPPNSTWADGLWGCRVVPSSAATADAAAEEARGSSEWTDKIPIGMGGDVAEILHGTNVYVPEEVRDIEFLGPPIETLKMKENKFLPIRQEPTSWRESHSLHKPNPRYAVGAERAPRQAPPRALPPQAAAQEAPRASSYAQMLPLTSLDLNVLHGQMQTRMRMPPQGPMQQQQTCMPPQGPIPQGWLNGHPSAFVRGRLTVPFRPPVGVENERPGAQVQESLVYSQPTGALGRQFWYTAPLGGLAPNGGIQSLSDRAGTLMGQDVGVLSGTRHDYKAPLPTLDLNPEFRRSEPFSGEGHEALHSSFF